MRKNVESKKKNLIEKQPKQLVHPQSIAHLIKPNGNRVFIKKYDRETKSSSGKIYLAIDPAKAQIENMGIIVGVGDNIKDEACRVGVKVAFDSVLEMSINIDGGEYFIIKEDNIFCYFYDQV